MRRTFTLQMYDRPKPMRGLDAARRLNDAAFAASMQRTTQAVRAFSKACELASQVPSPRRGAR